MNLTKYLFSIHSQSHEDYRGLERAKEAMVDVAQYTNEVKRDSEHLGVIQKVKVWNDQHALQLNHTPKYYLLFTGQHYGFESSKRP